MCLGMSPPHPVDFSCSPWGCRYHSTTRPQQGTTKSLLSPLIIAVFFLLRGTDILHFPYWFSVPKQEDFSFQTQCFPSFLCCSGLYPLPGEGCSRSWPSLAQSHRLPQAGKRAQWSLDQAPAHGNIHTEFRPGSLGQPQVTPRCLTAEVEQEPKQECAESN